MVVGPRLKQALGSKQYLEWLAVKSGYSYSCRQYHFVRTFYVRKPPDEGQLSQTRVWGRGSAFTRNNSKL